MAAIGVVLAVIGIALAVWALLRPAPAATPASPSVQQVADAKARACGAFTKVRTAVAQQTHLDLGADPVAAAAAAANGRISMVAGSSYLLARLDPATPEPLATAIRSFTADLQDIGMNALTGVGNDDPAQAGLLRDAQAASARIADLCK